jgi:probable phosphoglycerate mutase
LDSKLLVEQMSGRWQVKHPAMRELARQAAQLASSFAEINYSWIPRAQNSDADRLANEAMDAAAGGAAKNPLPAVAPSGLQQLEMPTPQTAWVPPDSERTRLILVRHGVTEYSVAKRFAGRSDLPLTEDGVEQAKRAARRVSDLGPVDVIVSSPLQRTRQTAQQISDVIGVGVEVSDGFAETDFGDWDGFTFAEVQQRWPDELQAWLADPSVSPPKGESFDVVTRRVRRARDKVLAAHPGKTIAVVSHVSPIKILVRLALDAPPSALHRMFLAPAAISVVDYYPDGPTSLRAFNDNAHL